MANKQTWYLFRRNEDMEWALVRKTFESKEDAVNYALNHNYQYSMATNFKELYHGGSYIHG